MERLKVEHVAGNYYRTDDGFLVNGQGMGVDPPECWSCGDTGYETLDKRDIVRGAAMGETVLTPCRMLQRDEEGRAMGCAPNAPSAQGRLV